MTLPTCFKPSPWDSSVFGMPAYEIVEPSPENMEAAQSYQGHYTVRTDPLTHKKLLNEHGFYYCDTLIEPHCSPDCFISFDHSDVTISRDIAWQPLLNICHGAFSHGRFHRDFNLNPSLADQRYNNWLFQLYEAGQVYGLIYQETLAGFIAINNDRLVLHAVDNKFRGKGLAKYLWTPVCKILFDQGHCEIISSVSASNLAIVNLYAKLGFRFRNPIDIYHRLTL